MTASLSANASHMQKNAVTWQTIKGEKKKSEILKNTGCVKKFEEHIVKKTIFLFYFCLDEFHEIY